MFDWLRLLFDTSDFPARWNCGNWSDELGWLHIISDGVVFLCYMAIPLQLMWFRRNRSDLPFPRVFSLFAIFILSCGVTHLIEAIIFWQPIYRVSGLAKMTTAGASLATVAYLFPTIPKLFALRSPAELQAEVERRRSAENELKALQESLEQEVRARTSELLAARDRLELALHAGRMGIMQVDLLSGRVVLDDSASHTLGRAGSSVDWRSVLERVLPADRDKLEKAVQDAIHEAQHRASASVRLVTPDGVARPIEARIAVDGEAEERRFLAVVWDAAQERENLEEARRLSEILEATPDFVVTADRKGHIVWQNASLRSWLAADPDASMSDELARQLLGPGVEAAKRNGSWLGEATITNNGRHRDVSQLLVVHRDVDLQVSHVSAILRDLGDRKAREEALRESEHRLRAAVDAAPNAMAMIDGEGRIRLHNAQFEQLFGYSAEELTQLTVDALVPPAVRERHRDDRARFAKSPVRRAMGGDQQLYGLHKGGRALPLEIGLNPLELDGTRLTLVAVVDISERLRNREALQLQSQELTAANENLREFAYAASHDLQEPLRKVIGFCQLIEYELGDDAKPKVLEYLGFAVDGAKRMQTLTRDLLEYSQLHQTSHAPEPIETAACVARALESLSTAIEESGAKVKVGPLPVVLGQELLLDRVFLNLIGNAIKYRAAGRPPRVEVDASADGATWTFHIRDNGIGIAPKDHERVFGVFQRLHGRSEYPGTGIGLAIVKKSVERCGGRIWVDPNSDIGTTVMFTLSAQPAKA